MDTLTLDQLKGMTFADGTVIVKTVRTRANDDTVETTALSNEELQAVRKSRPRDIKKANNGKMMVYVNEQVTQEVKFDFSGANVLTVLDKLAEPKARILWQSRVRSTSNATKWMLNNQQVECKVAELLVTTANRSPRMSEEDVLNTLAAKMQEFAQAENGDELFKNYLNEHFDPSKPAFQLAQLSWRAFRNNTAK